MSDAFAGVLAAIRRGHGPRDNFRGYLLAAVRNGCRLRWQRGVAAARGVGVDVGASPMFEDPERYVEADTVARAFAALTPRWQQTLWLTEVEQRSAAEVSEQLRLAANATAALTHRARQAFATAYLAEHVEASPDEACARYAPRLAGYVREQLSAAQRDEVEGHLVECPHCQQAVSDLRDLNASLRTLAPVTGSSIAAPLSAGTSMGATSTGMLSSGLLLKAAAAILVLTPVLVSDRSSGRGDVPATNEDNEFVAAESSPPLEATNTPNLTSSTQPPPATTTATTVSEPSLRRLQPAAITVIAQPTIPLTTDARLWPLPTAPLDGPINHLVNPLAGIAPRTTEILGSLGGVVGPLADIALGAHVAVVEPTLRTITAVAQMANAIAVIDVVLTEHLVEPLAQILGGLADLTTATIDLANAGQTPTSTAPIDPTSSSAEPTTTLPAVVTTPPQPQLTTPLAAVPPSIPPPPSTLPPVTIPPITVPPVSPPPATAPPVTVPPVSAPPVTLAPVTVPPITVAASLASTTLPDINVAATTLLELPG